jgi:hypothetical protein
VTTSIAFGRSCIYLNSSSWFQLIHCCIGHGYPDVQDETLVHSVYTCGLVHHNKTYSQVFGCIIGHIEQVVLGYCSWPKESLFLALPNYWWYLNFKSCVICASKIIRLKDHAIYSIKGSSLFCFLVNVCMYKCSKL